MRKLKLTFFAFWQKSKIPQRYRAQFEQEETEQLKAGSGVGVTGYALPLFLIFSIADFIFYPALAKTFLTIRIGTALSLLAVSFSIKNVKKLRTVEILSSLNVQICACSILLMLFLINDPHSSYDTGLFLVITGAAVSLRFKLRTIALNLFVILFCYSIVEFLVLRHGQLSIFNGLMLFGICLIAFVTRVFMNEVQHNEFVARQNLNDEINERNRIIEKKTAENIRYKSLEKQFSPQVIKQISEGNLSLDELRDAEVGVVFYDIVNSTGKANEIDSAAYQRALNMFLEETIKILISYDLTIGGFLGDGILGFTNQPFVQKNFIDRILLASLEVHAMIQSCQSDFAACWGEEFSITTGISSGPAKVGFFGGTAAFRHYTAIGPVVNKAKRISSCCKQNEILFDDSVHDTCLSGGYDIDFMDKFELKGFKEAQTLYLLKGKPSSFVVGESGEELEVVLNERGIYEFKERPNAKKKAA